MQIQKSGGVRQRKLRTLELINFLLIGNSGKFLAKWRSLSQLQFFHLALKLRYIYSHYIYTKNYTDIFLN